MPIHTPANVADVKQSKTLDWRHQIDLRKNGIPSFRMKTHYYLYVLEFRDITLAWSQLWFYSRASHLYLAYTIPVEKSKGEVWEYVNEMDEKYRGPNMYKTRCNEFIQILQVLLVVLFQFCRC